MFIVVLPGEEAERGKFSLASDLRWLINEGYVIEFNDGSLDLPRTKTKPVVVCPSRTGIVPAATEETVEAAVPAADESAEEVVAVVGSTTEPEKQASAAVDFSTTAAEETEIGG